MWKPEKQIQYSQSIGPVCRFIQTKRGRILHYGLFTDHIQQQQSHGKSFSYIFCVLCENERVINSYSPKNKLILLNTPQDEAQEMIIQRYSLSLRGE